RTMGNEFACIALICSVLRFMRTGKAERRPEKSRAPGIAAAGDDAEVAAGLPECLLIDVGLSGRLLDGARLLGRRCVVEVMAAGALHEVATRRCHITKLLRGAGHDRAGENRIALLH